MAYGSRPGHPHGLLSVWPRWERLVHQVRPVQPIPGAKHGLFRLRYRTYRGEIFALPDGTIVCHGCTVADLHLDGMAMLNLVKAGGNPFRGCREELRLLAASLIESDPDGRLVAFKGVTLLGNAAERIGFFVRQRPVGRIKARIERWFMSGFLILYTVDGMERLGRGATMRENPREVWLTRQTLIRKYGPKNHSSDVAQNSGSAMPEVTSAPVATPISASPAIIPAANSTPTAPDSPSPWPRRARSSAPSNIVTLSPNGR